MTPLERPRFLNKGRLLTGAMLIFTLAGTGLSCRNSNEGQKISPTPIVTPKPSEAGAPPKVNINVQPDLKPATTPKTPDVSSATIKSELPNPSHREVSPNDYYRTWGPSLIVGDLNPKDSDSTTGQIQVIKEGEEIEGIAKHPGNIIYGYNSKDQEAILKQQVALMLQFGGDGPSNPPQKVLILDKNLNITGERANGSVTPDKTTATATKPAAETYPGLRSGIYLPLPEYNKDYNDYFTFKRNSSGNYDLVDIRTNQIVNIKNHMTIPPIDFKRTDSKVDSVQQLYFEIGPGEAAIVQGDIVDGKRDVLIILTRRSNGNITKVQYYPQVYKGAVTIVRIGEVAAWAAYYSNSAVRSGRPYVNVHEIRDNANY